MRSIIQDYLHYQYLSFLIKHNKTSFISIILLINIFIYITELDSIISTVFMMFSTICIYVLVRSHGYAYQIIFGIIFIILLFGLKLHVKTLMQPYGPADLAISDKFIVKVNNIRDGSGNSNFYDAKINYYYDCNKWNEFNFNYSILLSIRNDDDIKVGDVLYVESSLEDIKNFGDFDYKSYLNKQGIYAKASPKEYQVIANNRIYILKLIDNLKVLITDKVNNYLYADKGALLVGIVFGIQDNISDDLQDKLSITGITHVVVASGYNVMIIVNAMMMTSKYLGRKRSIVLSILFICIYVGFVGIENAPIVRAGLFGFSMIIGQILGRKRVSVNFLIYTALLMVILNPMILTSISFQLSFAASFGLLVFSNISQKFFELARLNFLAKNEEFVSTFTAILFTTPITLGNFNTFSMIAILVNMLILSIVPQVMIYGSLFILTTFFNQLNIICVSLSYVLNILLDFFLHLIEIASKIPFASVEVNVDQKIYYVYLILLIIIFEFNFRLNARNNTKQ